MAPVHAAPLQPRKSPVQARSVASVDAILQATLQVLVATGKERLTTTRVAHRAGVSVGTLYQYFPNKSSLLQACLKQHMEIVSAAVECACAEGANGSLLTMGEGLISAYLQAKMVDAGASASLYAVASDVDGTAIVKSTTVRIHRAAERMFATAREGLAKEPALVASVVLAAMNGVARRLLESPHPERQLPALREELNTMVRGYLKTCGLRPVRGVPRKRV